MHAREPLVRMGGKAYFVEQARLRHGVVRIFCEDETLNSNDVTIEVAFLGVGEICV